MIAFDLPAARFSYRVVGVALHDGHALLHRATHDEFWSLPGGRCEATEASDETLIREMQEEMGLPVKMERLLWIVENFFTLGEQPYHQAYHELGLYYLMRLPADAPQLDVTTPFPGMETNDIPLIFQWFPLTELPSLQLYPYFLRASLQALPDRITQVITHDEVDGGPPVRVIIRQ
jgi:ADP-ribose pyrophosphatase YjhB (NUDIX family)